MTDAVCDPDTAAIAPVREALVRLDVGLDGLAEHLDAYGRPGGPADDAGAAPARLADLLAELGMALRGLT
jgi:hypothetical protein